MIGALLILVFTLAIGMMLWAWERWRSQRHGHSIHHHNDQQSTVSDQPTSQNAPRATQNAVCCGLHAICEKTGQINEPPVYYDDEELDRFAGRDASDYTDEETEEFRDVLLTLMPSDAPGWNISLEKRRINLPETLKPELELMLSEG